MGADAAPELAQAWEERTGAPAASFYGAMDIGQLAVPRPDDPQDKRWHTVGRPHDRAEWAIRGYCIPTILFAVGTDDAKKHNPMGGWPT